MRLKDWNSITKEFGAHSRPVVRAGVAASTPFVDRFAHPAVGARRFGYPTPHPGTSSTALAADAVAGVGH